jgi:hypothetical protein
MTRTMAVAGALLAGTMLAAPALSQGRPSAPQMTCRQAAGLVAAQGAVVLGTGGPTYDRFVRDRRFCAVTEAVQRAFVVTRDSPACFVGYRCFEPSRDDLFEKF